ncbi:MAG TPA: hypothetical protein VMI54_02745 [Polyangiaceae bacterium]|nr:hypothetical protein [Polyangiaceae bacterium]
MKTRGRARLVAHVAVVGALLLAGCQRKAPGPDECRVFALHAYGLHSEDEIRFEKTLDDVDDLTTECLVTPYDRELLACVDQGIAATRCMSQFRARHSGAPAEDPSLRAVRRRRREAPAP